jgi:hypothetical protein
MLFDEAAVLIVHLPSTTFGHILFIILTSCCSVRCASTFLFSKVQGGKRVWGFPSSCTLYSIFDRRAMDLSLFISSSRLDTGLLVVLSACTNAHPNNGKENSYFSLVFPF